MLGQGLARWRCEHRNGISSSVSYGSVHGRCWALITCLAQVTDALTTPLPSLCHPHQRLGKRDVCRQVDRARGRVRNLLPSAVTLSLALCQLTSGRVVSPMTCGLYRPSAFKTDRDAGQTAAEVTGARAALNLSQNDTSFFHFDTAIATEADHVLLELEAL